MFMDKIFLRKDQALVEELSHTRGMWENPKPKWGRGEFFLKLIKETSNHSVVTQLDEQTSRSLSACRPSVLCAQ
jgi:hypothetical protein